MNDFKILKQRGFSPITVLIVLAFLGMIGIVGAKVMPTFSEYMAINKAVKKAAADGGTIHQMKKAFDLIAVAEYIESIKGNDLQFRKVDGNAVIDFEYNKEIVLVEPVYLLIKYKGTSAGAI